MRQHKKFWKHYLESVFQRRVWIVGRRIDKLWGMVHYRFDRSYCKYRHIKEMDGMMLRHYQ